MMPNATKFCKFCSSQAYAPNTFGPNRGFVDQLYITGEECPNGRLFVLDSLHRDLYQLTNVTGSSFIDDSAFGIDDVDRGGIPFNPFENAALIDTNETDHIALLLSPDRHSQNETLKLYIGHKGKDSNGSDSSDILSRNGLAYGQWYYLQADYPNSAGDVLLGVLANTSSGGLAGTKLEDVDTSPSQPNRVVLAESKIGIFILEFNFTFSDAIESSTFTIMRLNSDGIQGQDNVDWTDATVSNPDGIIYVNEDSGRGGIWKISPSNHEKYPIGRTTTSEESSGIFDLSHLVDYDPGTIMATSNQGFPASLTLLIDPTALPSTIRVYEAETAMLQGCSVSTRHPWYHGSGYADFGGAGSLVEWTVPGDQIYGGKYKAAIAYASGDNFRQCDLLVNGNPMGELNLFGSDWDIWSLEVLPDVFELLAGQNVTITMKSQKSQGPNVDFLALIPQKAATHRTVATPSWTSEDGAAVYEAEYAKMVRARVKVGRSGFNGTGYADFHGKYGSLEWFVDIPSFGALFELTFRYTTSRTRPTKLIIDGREQSSLLQFPSTSGWENWETITTLVVLHTGTHSIKVSTSNVSEGPNIDWMSVKRVDKDNELSTAWFSDGGNHGQRYLRGDFVQSIHLR